MSDDDLAHRIVRSSYGWYETMNDDSDSYERIKAERDYYYMLRQCDLKMAWDEINKDKPR